jgi:Transport and Golgi organisation 2
MSLLAVLYRLVPESPILVAANREEYYDRPSQSPSIQSGKPRVLCGLDQRAGGTWLGVNQHGLFVGLCNRRTTGDNFGNRSRGLLAREVLRCSSARKGVDKAMEELMSHRYEGLNLIVCDAESGWVVHSDQEQEVLPLEDGLNIISSQNLNDPNDERVQLAHRLLTLQMLDSPVKFLAVASKVFARGPATNGRPSMIMKGGDYGTVSSTLIALSPKPRDAIFQYAGGSPDEAKYEDFSPMLRDILSRGLREARSKVKTT